MFISGLKKHTTMSYSFKPSEVVLRNVFKAYQRDHAPCVNLLMLIFCHDAGQFWWWNKDDDEKLLLKFCKNYDGKPPAYWDNWPPGEPAKTYGDIEWTPNKSGLLLPSFIWGGKRWRLLKSGLRSEFFTYLGTLLKYD